MTDNDGNDQENPNSMKFLLENEVIRNLRARKMYLIN